jgi:hypothetical protein
MHKPLFRIAVGSVAAVGGLIAASAMPAGAATAGRAETMARTTTDPTSCPASCSEDTPVTFTVGAVGVLSISVPTPTTPISLGGVSGTDGGTTGGGSLGNVAVSDTENSNPAEWTVSVNDSIFRNTAVSTDTIPASAATYTSGGVTVTLGSGSGATIKDDTTGGLGLTTSAQKAIEETGADGANAANWSPTVTITVPPGSIAGTYTGTITHSIS